MLHDNEITPSNGKNFVNKALLTGVLFLYKIRTFQKYTHDKKSLTSY
ncbi:hypothetical protein P615_07620 [Brevibacillus laterosporus PE36]|nr:hypothetical protein P615_07620 [Brevibacillus laterosporus PE36]